MCLIVAYECVIILVNCYTFLLEGPSAMIRGALMYGGLIYFTSGARRNGQIQEFTEQPAIVDF